MDVVQRSVVFQSRIAVKRLEVTHGGNAACLALLRLIQLPIVDDVGSIEGVDERNTAVTSDTDRCRRNPNATQERQEFSLQSNDVQSHVHIDEVDGARKKLYKKRIKLVLVI